MKSLVKKNQLMITALAIMIAVAGYLNFAGTKLSDEELHARPQQPLTRKREVSKALRAYAKSVSSADKGGVRMI